MKTTKLPAGICFADRQSKANFQMAFDGARGSLHFQPMLVIQSSFHGTGKTRLARHLLEARFGSAQIHEIPKTARGWDLLVRHGAKLGYLFFDDVESPVRSRLLSRVTSASEWSARKWRSAEFETYDIENLQVVMTGRTIDLGADLARRSLYVELI